MKVHTLRILIAVTIVNCANSWWDTDSTSVFPKALLGEDKIDVRKINFRRSSEKEMKELFADSIRTLGKIKNRLSTSRIKYISEIKKLKKMLKECRKKKGKPSQPPVYDYPYTAFPEYDYDYKWL